MSQKNIKMSRQRGSNFTKEEQLLLFKVLEAFTPIIECKKTDSVRQIDKQNAWSKVTDIFNANTKGVPRTCDNLLGCYRNAKSKLKKQHSEAKMMLKDPSKKNALLNALEENGKDWEMIASSINEPIEICQQSFQELKKEFKKEEIKLKKTVMGTGGGPAPTNDENPLDTIKKIIDPQIDGLFTMYDGDRDIMSQFQNSLPEEQRLQPIEIPYVAQNTIDLDNNIQEVHLDNNSDDNVVIPISTTNVEIHTPVNYSKLKRTDILRKRKAPELETIDNIKEKKNLNTTIRELSEEKMELVKLQKLSIQVDIEHKQKINESELQERLAEQRIKNEMHLSIQMDNEHKKQLRDLELQEKLADKKFKEEMRKKELILLDLKIKHFK